MDAREAADDSGVGDGFAVAAPRLDDFVEERECEAALFTGEDVDVEAVDGTGFRRRPGVVGLGEDGEINSFCGDGLEEFAEETGRVAVAAALFPEEAGDDQDFHVFVLKTLSRNCFMAAP